MIIEGLITTEDADGRPHVSPLGPVVDSACESWTLRPFKSSNSFKNLRRNPACCFHVTDDVLAVTKLVLKLPHELPISKIDGVWRIDSACHWYHLCVREWNLESDRTEARATVEDTGCIRPFWGWNRAKHCVLEAAILMTRTHILEKEFIDEELRRLESPVEKTAGPDEYEAWQLIQSHWAS